MKLLTGEDCAVQLSCRSSSSYCKYTDQESDGESAGIRVGIVNKKQFLKMSIQLSRHETLKAIVKSSLIGDIGLATK